METKQLSSSKLPLLGFGTWKIGGHTEPDYSKDEQYIKIIQEFIKASIDSGIVHIDTAEMYGNGHAEEIISKAIKSLFNEKGLGIKRESLFITSKVWHNHLKYDDLINSCRLSLKRLGTDYLDLYLIHWPNPKVDMKETMKALNFLVEKGLVRHIGLSNFSVQQIKEAQESLISIGSKLRIFALQMEYNLLVRNKGKYTLNMESELLPYCKAQGINIIAWRPLADGILAKLGIKVLDDIARKHNKTPAQVALNWLYCKGIATVAKCSSIEHLKEDLGSLGWKLDKEDMIALDNLKEKDTLHKQVLPIPE